MEKVYCKNCKNRMSYSRMNHITNYYHLTIRYPQCVIITKNKYTGIRTIIQPDGNGPRFPLNVNGECGKYKRKWWKFWVKE